MKVRTKNMFSIKKVGNNVNSMSICDFTADTVADIAKLPRRNARGTQTGNDLINDCVSAGSTCFVIENSSLYMLSNADVWTEI